MSGVLPNTKMGPRTFEVNASVTGGQLVEPDGTTGRIKPATANSTTVLGVAAANAEPAGSDTDTNYSTYRPHVAVYYGGFEMPVTYAANATFGQLLKAAANGQVTPYTPGAETSPSTDTQVVGRCTEPAGVSAGQVGLMRTA